MVTLEERRKWRERPQAAPVMVQRWQRLLFLHWILEPQEIQPLLPKGLTVDLFEGQAYLGVVPFEMRNIRPLWSPVIPYISNFLELNLRTYVIDEYGRPGVYFISLNSDRWIACAVGRAWFHLPYFWSRLSCQVEVDGWVDYRFQRRGSPAHTACRYQYRPLGTPAPAQPGTLDDFLVERYLLFTERRGELTYGQVHHAPYPLQSAEVVVCENRFLKLDGFAERTSSPVHACYVDGVNVEVFPLQASNSKSAQG